MLLPSCALYWATALIKQLSGKQPIPASAVQRLANGHTEISVTKKPPVQRKTADADESLDAPKSWQVKEDTSEPFLSLWEWQQIKMTHLYTTTDQKSEEKGKLLIIFFFLLLTFFFFFTPQSTSYSYRFNPMDYILFCSFISLLYLRECFWNS